MSPKLKVFFYMINAVGPQNACIGLGQALLSRGHQIYFLTKSDKFSKYGFTVFPIKDPPLPGSPESSSTKTPEEIQREEAKFMGLMFGLFDDSEPLEKLKRLRPSPEITGVLFNTHVEHEKQIRVLIEREKPDLIVVDMIGVVPPVLICSNIPWVYVYCSNPLGLFNSDELPPPTSGYPVSGDRSKWAEYRQVYRETHDEQFSTEHRKLLAHFNYPPQEEKEGDLVLLQSPYLNIYQFPKELDYDKLITLPKNFFRVDAFCRDEVGSEFELPEHFRNNMKPGDKLIYFSLGSIGTTNVDLVKRILSVLAQTNHWYIVSKGSFASEYDLPSERMWGGNYLPQTKILPKVDLAIIHGGNNSLTEALTFGTPIIVMPLFYDQFDNAQRIAETEYGIRIDPYHFKDQELLSAIEEVLGNRELKLKFQEASQRIKADNSKVRLCVELENVVKNFKNK